MEYIPPETLESFRRVVIDSSVLDQAKEELENVRIVLRSYGRPFPPSEDEDEEVETKRLEESQPKLSRHPRFVVALAYHPETHVFHLFCFSRTVFPCRFVRLNLDGEVVDPIGKVIIPKRRNKVPGKSVTSSLVGAKLLKNGHPRWNKNDACALLAALIHVHKSCKEYFSTGSTEEVDTAMESNSELKPAEMPLDHAECLRLVSEISREEKSVDISRSGDDEFELTQSGELKGGHDDAIDNDTPGKAKEVQKNTQETKEDIRAIRKLILNALLQSKDMVKMNFQHPNPEYLLPLSQVIADELQAWRNLCGIAPLLLSQYRSDKEREDGAAKEGLEPCNTKRIGGITKAGQGGEVVVDGQVEIKISVWEQLDDNERQELVEVITEREKYQQACLEFCKGVLKTVYNMVDEFGKTHTSDFENDKPAERKERSEEALFRFALRFGKDILASATALEHMQKDHRQKLSHIQPLLAHSIDTLLSFEKKKHCLQFDDNYSQDSNDYASTSEKAMKTVVQDVVTKSPSAIDEATQPILDSWDVEDGLLFNEYSAAISSLEKCMNSIEFLHSMVSVELGDEFDPKEVPASRYLQIVEEKLESIVKMGRKATLANYLYFLEERNKRSGRINCKRNPWDRSLTRPIWTDEQAEAFLTFGQSVAGEGNRVRDRLLAFAVDHTWLSVCFRSCIDSWMSHDFCDHGSGYDSDGDYYLYNYDYEDLNYNNFTEEVHFHYGDWLDSEGNMKKMKVSIEPALEINRMTERCLEAGDLLNAAFPIICFSTVLCYKDAIQIFPKYFKTDKSVKVVSIKELMENLDSFATKVVLAAADNYGNDEFTQWFDCFLRSGAVYFPTGSNQEGCRHVASSIFTHKGWNHPTLCRALNGDESAIEQWSQVEAPIVIKERFLARKEKKNENTLSLARMLQGDQDAVEFLMTNGHIEMAIEQASSCHNVEGLAYLGSNLVDSNPCASLQCIHASISIAIKMDKLDVPTSVIDTVFNLFFSDLSEPKSSKDSVMKSVIHGMAIPSCSHHDILHEVLMKQADAMNSESSSLDSFHSDLSEHTSDEETNNKLIGNTSSNAIVPPLQLICTMAFCRTAFYAAKSEPGLLQLLENNSIEESGICFASIAVAIIAGSTQESQSSEPVPFRPTKNCRTELMKYLLEKSRLFISSSKGYRNNFSGILEELDLVPPSLGKKNLLDICCAIYQASKIWIEEGCSASYCIEIAVYSALKIAALSGCESFVTEILAVIGDQDEESFSLKFLTECYSSSFRSKSLRAKPKACEMLLESYLSHSRRSGSRVGVDTREATIWVAIALMQYQEPKKIAASLADCMIPEPGNYHNSDVDKELIESFRALATVDTENASLSKNGHTMSLFALSTRRVPTTESQREEICSFLLIRIFKSTTLGHSVVAEFVRTDRILHPSYWKLEVDQFEQRLANPNSFDLYLSDKSSLRHMCIVLHFIYHSIKRNETWCSSCFIVVCGLRWLRNVLVSSMELVQFGQASDIKHRNSNYDSSLLSQEGHWSYDAYRYSGRGYYDLDNRPMIQARALVTVLRENTQAVEDSAPYLSHLCQETLILCSALELLVEPSLQRMKRYADHYASFGHAGTLLPHYLQPCEMISFVMQDDWGSKSDFVVGENFRCISKQMFELPFLLHRVRIAVEYDTLEAGVSLCVCAAGSYGVWNELIKTYSVSTDVANYCRDILQGCLLVLEKAILSKEELPEKFIDMAFHLTATMNWFRCCPECHDFFQGGKKNDTDFLVPSVGNLSMMRNIAFVLNEHGIGNYQQTSEKMSYFLHIVCCLSRCCTLIEDQQYHKLCGHCRFKRQHYEDERYQEQPQQGKNPTITDVESDFRELESCVSQFGMVEQSDWCKFVLRNVIAEKEQPTTTDDIPIYYIDEQQLSDDYSEESE